MATKLQLHIEGTHCQGCKARIEGRISQLKGVKSIAVNYTSGETLVWYEETAIAPEKIIRAIGKLGYAAKEQSAASAPLRQPLALRLLGGGLLLALLAVGYFALQRSDALQILSRLSEQRLSYGLILMIGVLAGFHCVGMCGGLVVAYTTRYQNQEQGTGRSLWPLHLQYNLGRLLSYTAIGAILGGFGSFFALSPIISGLLSLVAGLVMVVMGLSFLGLLRGVARFLPSMPPAISRLLYNDARAERTRGPFVVGLLNGLMPCGPLQAMQLYALASGDPVRGALSMGVYALGTIPVMLGLGSILSWIGRERSQQVMKAAGAIVALLGVLMISRAWVNLQMWQPAPVLVAEVVPLPTAPSSAPTTVVAAGGAAPTTAPASGAEAAYQTVRMQVTYNGYEPETLQIKEGIPVRWVIDVKQMTRCTNEIILPEYNIRKKLAYGENIIEFTPKRGGEIKFSCWMRMVWGKFVVS